MELRTLRSECKAYAFEVMHKKNKPKNWAKNVSALVYCLSVSLFFGVDHDSAVKSMCVYIIM